MLDLPTLISSNPSSLPFCQLMVSLNFSILNGDDKSFVSRGDVCRLLFCHSLVVSGLIGSLLRRLRSYHALQSFVPPISFRFWEAIGESLASLHCYLVEGVFFEVLEDLLRQPLGIVRREHFLTNSLRCRHCLDVWYHFIQFVHFCTLSVVE